MKVKSIKVKVKNKSQTWDWLVFCIKSPELKIVPVADTTAAWAFDVEVAAKQNDDKYVPYQGFASQERVLKRKDYNDNNNMVICLITRLT